MSFRPDQYLTNETDPLRKSEWNKLSMKAPQKDSGKHESMEFTQHNQGARDPTHRPQFL